jgi:hypothetical protein
VVVWYRVGEREGNGKGSVVICDGLVQRGGDGGKYKVFSGDVWWFGTGWGSRREMGSVQWSSFVVRYRVVETEGNGKGSEVMCDGLVQGGEDGGKWKGFSCDVCWFGTGWRRRKEMERVQWCCVVVWYWVGD